MSRERENRPNIPLKIILNHARYMETSRGLLPWHNRIAVQPDWPILLLRWFDAAHG
jgi:hypothetical protein